MSDRIAVTFAYPYTDAGGKNHSADASASLPREEAKNLIHFGRARAVKDAPAPSAPKKAVAKKAAAPQAPAANASKEK